MKIGIVGTGQVGSATAYALALTGAAIEMVLLDHDPALARAQAEDIAHAVPFASATRVAAGDYPDLAGAGIVVIAAGVPQAPGETRLDAPRPQRRGVPRRHRPRPRRRPRRDPARRLQPRRRHDPGGDPPLRPAARPRHRLRHHPRHRPLPLAARPAPRHRPAVGARLRARRARRQRGPRLVLRPRRRRGARLLRRPGRRPARPTPSAPSIDTGVRRAAYTIIEGKGATWYGIGAGLARLAAAIARDEGAVFSVAIATPEVEGVTDVALSIPRVIARAGVTADLFPDLAPAEHAAFRASAAMLKDLADSVPL